MACRRGKVMRFRTAVVWSLVVALMVVGASGAVAGQGDASDAGDTDDACDEVLTNRTDGEPGEELAGAIGEQESAIDSELGDRRFEARLRNASTDAERAEVVASELDRLRTHADALEACAAFLHNENDAGDLSDEALREQERALAVRANATADRVNETAAEARTLPTDLRQEYGIDADAFDALRERVLALRESLGAGNATGVIDGSDGERDGDSDDDETPWPWR